MNETASGYEFSRWKLTLLAMAGVLMLVGGIVAAFEGDPRPVPEPSDTRLPVTPGGTRPLGESGFTGRDSLPPLSDDLPTLEGESDERSEWSPAFLRGGFGLFLGFCVGFALRVFVRLVALVIGFQLVLTFFLAHLGWVDVQWDVMQSQGQELFARLGTELASFKSFLLGHIPSAGAAGLGLFTGLKRK